MQKSSSRERREEYGNRESYMPSLVFGYRRTWELFGVVSRECQEVASTGEGGARIGRRTPSDRWRQHTPELVAIWIHQTRETYETTPKEHTERLRWMKTAKSAGRLLLVCNAALSLLDGLERGYRTIQRGRGEERAVPMIVRGGANPAAHTDRI